MKIAVTSHPQPSNSVVSKPHGVVKRAYQSSIVSCIFALASYLYPLSAQNIQTFTLPNGLQVKTCNLTNTGIVNAKLVFTWTEGTNISPIGTAWIMSGILPTIGASGMDRPAFQKQKDQAGTLSTTEFGNGWIAWTFDSVPANADLMVQFLADQALRPTWPQPEKLSSALTTLFNNPFRNDKEQAIHAFKASIGDPNTPQLPPDPIDMDQFITLWATTIRRPEKAVLYIAGDIETISVVRLVNQHFGPWEGIRFAEPNTQNPTPKTQKAEQKTYLSGLATQKPELWIGWDLQTHTSQEADIVRAYMPLILNHYRPQSDGIIELWEPDLGGQWIYVAGAVSISAEKLKDRALSILNQPLTQESVKQAVKTRNINVMSNSLYPSRAFETAHPPSPTQSETIFHVLKKCLHQSNLSILLVQ
ncbi:MAG: insulinase family protein [Holophagaceae bacterium]|nr:insulinase family protein [Holophagaceae bacterium]